MFYRLIGRPWARASSWVPCKAYLTTSVLGVLGVLVVRGGRL